MTQRTIIAIISIALILLGGIGTTGCKKYPEGPTLSLLTKNKRLLRNWSMRKFYVDGIDSTNLKTFVATKVGFALNGFNPIAGAYRLEDYSLLPAVIFSLSWSENKDFLDIYLDDQLWEIDSNAYSKTIFYGLTV